MLKFVAKMAKKRRHMSAGFAGWVVCAAALFAAWPSSAYMAFMQTGDIPEPGHYQISSHLQFAASEIDGITLAGRGESRLTEATTLFTSVGFGAIKFMAGFGLKWVPYPDFEQQPALGATFSVWYGYNEWQITVPPSETSEVSLRVTPFASKKYQVEFGELNAYVALPFGATDRERGSRYPIHLVAGFAAHNPEHKQIAFTGEIGLNLHDAFNYFTVGAAYDFDPEKGWVTE